MTYTNGKIYNEGESPSWILKDVASQYFYLRTGVVEHVDLDKYTMSVRWTPGNAIRPSNIPIPFAYAGPAGCMGTPPEKGAIGIFGFMSTGADRGSPLCIGFLPAGLEAGLNNNEVKVFPDAIPTNDINKIQFKFRKLTQGDMNMGSPLGSRVFLNEDVEIHDESQDSIVIREGDQSIISTSLNNFVFADGVSISSGPAIRNAMVLYDKNGEKIPNNGSLLSLPNGKDNIYITPNGEDIGYDTPFYAEYRIDVDEMGSGNLDLNDINSMSPLSTRDPMITFALGNYVGSDRMDDKTYGRNLKPSLFDNKGSRRSNFALTEAIQKNGMDEPSKIGLVYALHFRKSGCFFGVDKEGHYTVNLPASKSNDIGAGRSMSLSGEGNLKEVWGPDNKDQNSWDLTTEGGIKWNIGSHGTTNKSRSIDIESARGIYINVKGADDENVVLAYDSGGSPSKTWTGFSRQEYYKSNVYESVGGGKRVSVGKEFSTKIGGLKEEIIDGSATQSVQSDKSLSVGSVYSETVTKEKQGKYLSRKTDIGPKGNDKLEVAAGNIIQTITTFGQRKASFNGKGGVFNITETIGNAKHETKINAGRYTLDCVGAKIDILAPIGTIKIDGSSITLNGSLITTIDSPIVKLGSGALIGGVVSGLPGKPTHADYTTGAPLKGSFKVSVG